MASNSDLSISCADPLLTEAQAAHLLALKQTTLQQWRIRGTGPAYIKLGAAAVRYRRSTLETWLNDRTVHSTVDDVPQRIREAAFAQAGGGFTTAASYRAGLPLAGSPAAALAMAADEGARA
ncbi:helix-turn-helix transcriptional regulator [Methylobacterium sp. MA0201]|uniref:helix-turn-helix transcriptional regulator n=1 Tax=Methylobacterium alsaeris TaxID=3344826 RepID=UPI003756423C